MKCKFGFIVGACMIIGMVDLMTDQVVFAAIYNPLDPSEEIVPIDPPLAPEETAVSEDDQAVVKKEVPDEPLDNPESEQIKEIITKSTLLDRKQHGISRVMIEDVFSNDLPKMDVALPENDPDGDGDDRASYLASLCYLFSGHVLYGQKNEGGMKTRVCDIFE
ncbi:hypothetical protein [Enterococcus sp. DIV0876]|uniref:hypothetical protein n=1 Tax=Enterococcus sp. DIV0876 TaxID=2774633 RepID=UPI003D2F9F88